MSTGLLPVLGVGLVLGFRHAFEPDHLAAVSTLATRQGSLGPALRLGAAWGLGHTASVGVVIAAVIAFGVHLPPGLQPLAELVVALLLVLLGLPVVVRYARGRWHMHVHAHGGAPHLHLHSHAHGHSHAHAHPTTDALRALGLGVAHGLAGSAAVLVLLVAAAPTRAAQLGYLVAFGAGTIGGMLSVAAAITLVVRLATARGARWATAIHLTAAAASVAAGLTLAVGLMGR